MKRLLMAAIAATIALGATSAAEADRWHGHDGYHHGWRHGYGYGGGPYWRHRYYGYHHRGWYWRHGRRYHW